jgi:L-lactate dehydrogenase complex protein LldG
MANAGQLPRLVAAAVSDARTELLDRVAGAIAGGAAVVPQREYRRQGSLEPEARTRLFCERVDDYRADVVRLAASEVEATVTAICVQRGLRTLAIPPALSWRPDGVELVEDHGLSAHELDRLDGTLTGCTAAIAETGTIVLTAGPEEGRRALTLVPDLHICVVHEPQICELVPEALARLDPHRPITFVSGPSATSDIELSRVEGVHGPRTLIVLVAKEAA